MASEEEEENGQAVHFTLHLDKALACSVEIAAWNPEKDLLAMVTSDRQVTIHRFNWQKLWAVTPDKNVTSICWRPDGKALAVGHENGDISIHDVENGEIMRKIEIHRASIQCLHWAEEKPSRSQQEHGLTQEDRTMRFFPPPPKPPPMPGTGSAFDMVGGLEENARENAASKHFHQYLNILCSIDNDGLVYLNAFGMFAIGELRLRELCCVPDRQLIAMKVILSNDLRSMLLLCRERKQEKEDSRLLSVSIDTTLLNSRRNEIRQVALQASSVEELLNVLQVTLAVMQKHWFDAISAFTDKFTSFQELICKQGRESTPRDELLALLACGLVSKSLHQFLAATLGEVGLKKLARSIEVAGNELHTLISEHLQPSAELIAFRIGELLGLSRWRRQLQSIGLEEALVHDVMEHAGMLLVQVERFLHIVSDTIRQFRMFFLWLTKTLRQLNSEPVPPEQASAINSTLVAAFLNTQIGYDPIGVHLSSEGVLPKPPANEVPGWAETMLLLGGFKDVKFMQKTLSEQLNDLCASWRKAISKPVAVVSPGLKFRTEVFLCNLERKPPALTSIYYELPAPSDYTCFMAHADGFDYVGVVRGFMTKINEMPDVTLLQLDEDLSCVDIALYKNKQLVLLLSQQDRAWIMVVELDDLRFITPPQPTDLVQFCKLNGATTLLSVKDGKSRCIPQMNVIPPLAVSASRGLACVFASQRRAFLYDLEEDEEERDAEA